MTNIWNAQARTTIAILFIGQIKGKTSEECLTTYTSVLYITYTFKINIFNLLLLKHSLPNSKQKLKYLIFIFI